EHIKSLDDARDVLGRYSEFYDTKTIKQYSAGERKVRQWIIMAAREQRLMPTNEGFGELRKAMTEAIDGYSGHEHGGPITPLFKDVIQLFAQSGITYTPTLLVSSVDPIAKSYWYERYNIHDDPKLRRFVPHALLDSRMFSQKEWHPDDQYGFLHASQDLA